MSGHVTIWVSGRFTATHVCAEAGPHPHDFEVRACYNVAPRTDARCYRAALDHLLASWHGKALPEHIEWSEDIARAVYCLANCVRVEVWRDEERIGAVWPPMVA